MFSDAPHRQYNRVQIRSQALPIPNYYKLKQTDYDGKFIYSDIISVDNRIKAKIVSRMVSLMGTEVNEMYRGIVIIEYTDGSVEKIIR